MGDVGEGTRVEVRGRGLLLQPSQHNFRILEQAKISLQLRCNIYIDTHTHTTTTQPPPPSPAPTCRCAQKLASS